MKNLFIFITFLFPFTLFAQQETDSELDYKYHLQGSHSFSVGIGFPNLINSGFTIADQLGFDIDGGASPVFMAKYEYGLTPEIGAGFHLGYFTAKTPSLEAGTVTTIVDQLGGAVSDLGLCGILFECDTITESQEAGYDRYSVVTPGLRFAYHQRIIEQLDTYASVVIGYNLINKRRNGDSTGDLTQFTDQIPTFAYFTGAGARYYISPQWAVYGEIGYGALTAVNVGLTYRMK